MAKEEKVIDLKERKTVYATATHPYCVPGSEITVSAHTVEALKKAGFVTETKPKGKE